MFQKLHGMVEINAPSDSGIYFLCQGTEVVYVGQSLYPESRISQHKKAGKEFNRVLFLPVEPKDLDHVESLFIKLLEPKLNGKVSGYTSAPISVRNLSEPDPKHHGPLRIKQTIVPDTLNHFEKLPDTAFVRMPVVMGLFDIASATVWRWSKIGMLPAPKRFSQRCTMWNVGELREAISARNTQSLAA